MDNHQKRLNEANKAVKRSTNDIDKTFRLGYHIMSPANWINDPNGLVFYEGEYHVFYQHHPFDSTWGPMYWGHTKSSDLVHWEHMPIALAPGDDFDYNGCFSGCAIVDEDELVLFYTGHNFTDKEENQYYQNQNIARSKDGINFTKYNENPIIADPPSDSSREFRDPKVWKKEDTWYMILGNSTKDDRGRVILYKSKNLIDWTYCGPIAESDGSLGIMWECPDFFELNGKHILLFSPLGMDVKEGNYSDHQQTGYVIGDFDYDSNKFKYGEFKELDSGHDFYAVQTFIDDKQRRIAIGWFDMWESPRPTEDHGWVGVLTLPRELTLSEEGNLLMNPVEELEKLRLKKLPVDVKYINNEVITLPIEEALLELQVSFNIEKTTSKQIGIILRSSSDNEEKTELIYHLDSNKICLNRNKSGLGVAGERCTKLVGNHNELKLRIFLDKSSIEVFINDGENVLSSRIFPNKTSLGMKLFSVDGETKVNYIKAWSLKET